MRPVAIALIALALAGCGRGLPVATPGLGDAMAARKLKAAPARYVAASALERLNLNLSGVYPAVATPVGVAGLLAPGSCLGGMGPLGAYGPLGTLGPLGSNRWNPTAWMGAVGDWSRWSKQNKLAGPLGERGPLGPEGPLGSAYATTLPAINDFGKQLQAGGVFTALGPLGPLGALGPLGPLGPLGAHGFTADEAGRFMHGKAVHRTVTVPYAGEPRRYELYERYPEDAAKGLADNDTSFMAEGRIAARDEADTYGFASAAHQLVTVVVVPEKQLDDFDLVISDGRGKVLATSRARTLIDFVQLPVAAGNHLRATVTLHGSGHVLTSTYRLYVTGGTGYMPASDITGPHQVVVGTASEGR